MCACVCVWVGMCVCVGGGGPRESVGVIRDVSYFVFRRQIMRPNLGSRGPKASSSFAKEILGFEETKPHINIPFD